MKQSLKHPYEFLPAALEIEETPPNPIGRGIVWAVVALLLLAIVWASVGEIDIVATAQGKIITSGRDKLIQPLEAGVVRLIHVSEGQSVRAGDVLVELDPTNSGADAERVYDELAMAKLDVQRWIALASLDLTRTSDVAQLNAVATQASTAQQNVQQQLLLSQIQEHRAHLASLEATLAQRQAELVSARRIVSKLDSTLPLITTRAKALQGLKEKQLASEHEYLALEQQRLEQEHDLKIQRSKVHETQAAMRNVEEQKHVRSAEFARSAVDQLVEAQKRVDALEQERIKADKRSQLQQLVAPVTGTVQQLAIHTVGGVVTPAQALMIIVPQEQNLEAEALVQNKDIGFVESGQLAEIKIDTFPFTKYGTVPGSIRHVSTDAMEDKDQGLVYTARVALDQSVMHVGDKLVNLTPGMSVTVEVKTGKRRIIEYILSPLLRYQSESLRER